MTSYSPQRRAAACATRTLLFAGTLWQAIACKPEFPESKDLRDVIAKFDVPTGDLQETTGGEFAELFQAQQAGASDASDPILHANDSVGDSLSELVLPGRGFVQIFYTCDDTAEGAGTLRSAIVIQENVAQSTISFGADQCQLGDYWVDGSFDIDVGNETWVVASLDTFVRQGESAEPKAFVGALRVCRAQGTDCDRGDIELSVDIAQDQNAVVVFSAANGVLGLRDRSGHWSCSASLDNPQDAQCTHEALTITLPGVNP